MAATSIELIIERPCTDLLVEWAESLDGPRTPLEIGENILPPEAINVYVRANTDLPDINCCFDHWILNGNDPDSNRTIYIEGGGINTVELITKECHACTPRYKSYTHLVGKANCMCSNIGVEIVVIDQDASIAGFVIYDKCITEDENPNPFGIPYHIITVVMDPNYLLQTIECLCGSKSNPEYINTEYLELVN